MAVKVCWTLRMSAVSSIDSTSTSGASSIAAMRYGFSAAQRTMRTRWAPWTSTRSEPSGTRIIRAIRPATPTS